MLIEDYAEVKLRKREVEPGTFLVLRDARVARKERFRHDADYRETDPLPVVRAPGERNSCLERLAALAAA